MSTIGTDMQHKPDDYLVGKRKFIVWWAVFLSACTFLGWSKLTGDQFTDLVTMAFGLYMAGNVGEHLADRNKK